MGLKSEISEKVWSEKGVTIKIVNTISNSTFIGTGRSSRRILCSDIVKFQWLSNSRPSSSLKHWWCLFYASEIWMSLRHHGLRDNVWAFRPNLHYCCLLPLYLHWGHLIGPSNFAYVYFSHTVVQFGPPKTAKCVRTDRFSGEVVP